MEVSAFEKRPFLEMVLIVIVLLASALLFPSIKGVFVILSIVYCLVEPTIRKREPGRHRSEFSNLGANLKKSWIWILLVGVVMQIATTYFYKLYVPEMFDHVVSRASMIENVGVALILQLLFVGFGEELVFRGLVMERLQWVMKPGLAIVISAALFALMHVSAGTPKIVAIDLASVFVDGAIFGVIYYKTKSVYVAAIAHALADLVAVFLLMGM